MSNEKTAVIPIDLPSEYDSCGDCVNRIKNYLLDIDGVISVDINKSSEIVVAYDSYLTRLDEIKKHARSIGIEIQNRYLHKTYKLKGLDCPDCALVLENGVSKLKGVLTASANFASARLSVEYEPAIIDSNAIVERIKDLGYNIVDNGHISLPNEPVKLSFFQKINNINKKTILTSVSAILIAVALLFSALNIYPPLTKLFYGIAALSGGFYAFRGAYYSIRSFILDMDFLMSIAVIGAILIGEWFDAAMVMFLFSLGNALEEHTMEKTRNSVRTLIDGFPAKARVRRDGIETMISIDDIKINDVFIVLPGEKIPADGVISSGTTSVDQSSITGESMPADKVAGDMIFGGTMNKHGAIEAVVVSATQDNTLSKIIHLVEDAQTEKAPSQRFSESFGKYYTPVVVVLAVLTVFIPVAIMGADFKIWLNKALTLLVVSCPCALVISTPVSIVSAIGNAAHKGILIKGGAHLENLAAIDTVVFDKTGTITTGQLAVVDIIPFGSNQPAAIIKIAADVESRSDHPLAKAIINKANEMEIECSSLTDCETLVGLGASGVMDGVKHVVGSSLMMRQLGIDMSDFEDLITQTVDSGNTVVIVASDNKPIGMISLSDTLRSGAIDAINELRSRNINRIVMLTGDNYGSAKKIAADIGIIDFQSELLPQQKMNSVIELIKQNGNSLAFIGDGVNDAPSLAAATVGIAMGVAGSDTALETADIALMSNDLRKIPYAIRLGRAAVSVIKQNTIFALAVIALLIISALTGWINLSLGVFGHEGSALLVIANGMRLLKYN